MQPGSPEWLAKVTASKVSAILGLSPWDSPLTMWLRMHGDLPEDTSNADAKARGHYLEAGVVAWWLDQGEHLRSIVSTQPSAIIGDWAAATPDALAYDGDDLVIVEAKTDGKDWEWLVYAEDGTIVPGVPDHYAAQACFQLAAFPEALRVHFPVLHKGLAFREYVVERDADTIAAVVAACREFYDSLAADTPPPLSGMACEYEALRRVHTGIDKGAEAVIPDDLAAALASAYHAEKALGGLKATVLDLMGTAQYAVNESGQKVARRQAKGDAIALYVTAPAPATERPSA